MTDDETKRNAYHDGDGVLRHTDPEEEKKRISDPDKTDEKDNDQHIGENID
jgi:hypothetical protein